jgi:hypothetical protein
MEHMASGGDFNGPYYTESQIRGRVQFFSWVNPGRRRKLMAVFRSIRWRQVGEEAMRRGPGGITESRV